MPSFTSPPKPVDGHRFEGGCDSSIRFEPQYLSLLGLRKAPDFACRGCCAILGEPGPGGHRTWVDEVRSGSSFNSSSDLRLHFGLGSETKINSIEVRWPNGETEIFAGSGVDQFIVCTEGKSVTSPPLR